MVLDLWVISRQKKGVLVIKYSAFNLNRPSKIVKLKKYGQIHCQAYSNLNFGENYWIKLSNFELFQSRTV